MAFIKHVFKVTKKHLCRYEQCRVWLIPKTSKRKLQSSGDWLSMWMDCRVCVFVCLWVHACMDTRSTFLLLHHLALFCIERIKHHLPGDRFFCWTCQMIITLITVYCLSYFLTHSSSFVFSLCLLQHGWAPSPWGWSSFALPSLASSPTFSAVELLQWVVLLSAWSASWPAPLSRKETNMFVNSKWDNSVTT